MSVPSPTPRTACSQQASKRPVGGVFAVALALGLSLLTGCIQIDLFGRRGPLVETVIHGHGVKNGAKILMIEIDGVITLEETSSPFGPIHEGTLARVREVLDQASEDASLKGVLLRIDTPGGSATASDVIYGELIRFKRDRKIPIVAHFMGTATSGGYYIAMAADEISAEPTAVTGSIGVIFLGFNVAGLMERWGIEDQTITGGVHKDAGSFLRRMTPDERGIFQSVIDDLHARFRSVVAAGRPKLSPERIEQLADGRIYSAPQAVENGLVDSIGSIQDAIAAIERRVGAKRSVVVSYHRANEWRRNLYTQGPAPADTSAPGMEASALGPAALLRALAPSPRASAQPGFHYLWWPGSPAF